MFRQLGIDANLLPNTFEMNLYIPKITVEDLSNKQSAFLKSLDDIVYGKELASRVVKKLYDPSSSYNQICHSHKDYCGIGIFIVKNKPTIGTAFDGAGPWDSIADFESRTEFENWLVNQNDKSMALLGKEFNNQTISRIRLEWFLEENYSPVWNEFCLYKKHKI